MHWHTQLYKEWDTCIKNYTVLCAQKSSSRKRQFTSVYIPYILRSRHEVRGAPLSSLRQKLYVE